MFNELLQEITAATEKKRPRVIYKCAQAFDDLILDYEIVPDEAFKFLIALISNKQVHQSRGIEHFLLEMNVDFCKYTETQKDQLLKIITDHAGSFIDQLSRHSIGDFIARAYPPKVAYGTLTTLTLGGASENHVAFVGFDVLRARIDKTDALYGKVISQWNAILVKNSISGP